MSQELREQIDKFKNWGIIKEDIDEKKFYHSTFGRNIDNIMNEGLKTEVESLYPINSGYVYFTDNKKTSLWFAENYLKQTGEIDDIYILELSNLDPNFIEEDPYNDYPHIKSYRYSESIPPENIKIVNSIKIQ